VTDRDVERLARHLRMPPARFVSQYTMQDEFGDCVLRRTEQAGCVFLDGNNCTVYEARPDSCRYFPHLVRGAGSIASRMWQFVDRASYCPIVYNSMEAFKKELAFRR